MVAQKKLCLNGDKTAVVDCKSPDAAFVLAIPGQEIPPHVVKQYGLSEAGVEEKARTPGGNKARTPGGNK